MPFKVESGWFTGEARLTTYHLEELVEDEASCALPKEEGP